MNWLDRMMRLTVAGEESIEMMDVTEITPQVALGWLEELIPLLISFGKKLLAVLIFVFIARRFIKWLKKVLEKSFTRSDLDLGVSNFLLSLTNISLNVVTVIIAVNMLGIATGSITAILGSLGVTLGLALQGSLSNFFGGILILIMKPFKIGDYIIAGSDEGTVEGIDVFYTKLLTIDNRKIVIPNGNLSNQSIVNATNEEVRRLDIKIPIDYSENIGKVKEILWSLIKDETMVLKEPKPVVVVGELGTSAIIMEIRTWTQTGNYWPLKWKLQEEIKDAFDRNNIEIQVNQLEVTLNQSANIIRNVNK